MTMIELDQELERLRGSVLFDDEPVRALYRAALARAEAAEARVAELEAQLASDAADENQWLDAYIESAAKDGATIKRLMARVAELEAALVSDSELDTGPFNTLGRVIAERNRLAARVAELESQAAQQWRPVTEEPPLPDKYYLTDDTLPLGNEPFIVNYYSARREWANRCRVWFCPPPLPPAPQETEKPS